jgi:uncharacterized protein YaeQ
MAPNATIYRFRINVSDVDRGFYGDLDFRIAMHPSEGFPFMLTRVLAYALCFEEGLVFSGGGLSDPDVPSISLADARGGYSLWIEVGNPSARRLHKAAKAAKRVCVFTYKNPEALLREVEGEAVHKASDIEFYSIKTDFIFSLESILSRDNIWSLLRNEGVLSISLDGESFTGDLQKHAFR